MTEITCREFSVSLELSTDVEVNYNPSRELNTTVTGKRMKIKYVVGASEPYWYIELSGSYPLHTPEPVCECSPGVHKTRQRVGVRIGYPYAHRGVPAWANRLMVKNAPEWFPIPEF